MSWFKVDDTAHSHPKLRGAGTAAVGLWALGGSYAAQYLTDGIVHAHFVKTNATAPQVARLVKAGLWHASRHDCSSCRVQPADGDFLMHDYLDYNPSRKKVMAERERAAEKKRKQRSGTESQDGNGTDSSTNRDGIEEESIPNAAYNNQGNNPGPAGQSVLSLGDSLGTRARAVTRPDPSVPPKEEQTKGKTASYARGSAEPSRIGDRPRIPVNCQPLVDALSGARLIVGWDLDPADWFLIEALIARCGIEALVVSAAGSWQGARTQPRSATYFVPAWRALPDSVPQPGRDELPTAVGAQIVQFGPPAHGSAQRPAVSDLRTQQAIDVGRRLQAAADSQNQEN